MQIADIKLEFDISLYHSSYVSGKVYCYASILLVLHYYLSSIKGDTHLRHITSSLAKFSKGVQGNGSWSIEDQF